jgi:hypothetical protein
MMTNAFLHRLAAALGAGIAAAGLMAALAGSHVSAASPEALKPPSAFNGIADRDARSVALFNEAAKVITSPRCMNCHPANRVPTQGEDRHTHVPFIDAAAGGHGPPGLTCHACHQAQNVATFGETIATVPGNGHWGLAPASMAWQDKSVGGICRQLKDLSRNGGRDLAKIHEHLMTDPLVGWAWQPGEGRIPAPGNQVVFGELVQAWIDSGAACPPE